MTLIQECIASFSVVMDRSIDVITLNNYNEMSHIINLIKYFNEFDCIGDMSNKQKCIACNTIPEDVLVLSCNHCICLKCASNQVREQRQHQYLIKCSRCSEITELDQDLYRQLMNLVTSKPNSKRHQNVYNQDYLIRQDRQYRQNTHHQQLQRTCDFHQEYPIMYVCKTCNDSFICPQCVINGNHKNHVAVVIQKQGEKIKNKLQVQLSKIDQKIDSLQKMEIKRMSKIGQRRKELQRLRNIAGRQYEEIKQAIAKEQHTVISKCNQLIAAHQKQEQSFKIEVAKQIKLFQDQRIDIIDLLNPLLEQSIMGQSRAIQKMLMVNLVESYKKFTKDCQRNRQNYIKIAQQRMEEDMEVIQSLTQKIDRICVNQFQPNKRQIQLLENTANKHKYAKTQNNKNILGETVNNRQIPLKNFNQTKDDFFRLL